MNEPFSKSKLDGYKTRFQNIDANKHKTGYFAKNYGGKYFGFVDVKKIEAIRNLIESYKQLLNEKECSILLTSLIYSMDRCANTVGHYDAYRQKEASDNKFMFDLIDPIEIGGTQVEIYNEDANILVSKIKTDIAYIDPPYNSRQYCQFYHVYETIAAWNEPELFGAALKPKAKLLSEYCKSKAPSVFADLLTKLNCKYIVVSYNNTYASKSSSSRNKITLEQIMELLSNYGEVKSFSKSHPYFNAGKTEFQDHKEYLFIVEVVND